LRIPTASQTVGPFFNFGLTTNLELGRMAREGALGQRIRLTILVVDGQAIPAPGDAMVELWQADSQGRYDHPCDCAPGQADAAFCGFGRMETQTDGTCTFETVIPGRVGDQSPHINVTVFARGLLKPLFTRIYFADDPNDPVLSLVPAGRRATLLARAGLLDGDWNFTIRMQGDETNETVFFEL
jgi:protocatechuate 3,4-dioxygenase, alpha subunit